MHTRKILVGVEEYTIRLSKMINWTHMTSATTQEYKSPMCIFRTEAEGIPCQFS